MESHSDLPIVSEGSDVLEIAIAVVGAERDQDQQTAGHQRDQSLLVQRRPCLEVQASDPCNDNSLEDGDGDGSSASVIPRKHWLEGGYQSTSHGNARSSGSLVSSVSPSNSAWAASIRSKGSRCWWG